MAHTDPDHGRTRDEVMDDFTERVEEASVETGRESAEAVRALAAGPAWNLPLIGPIPKRTVIAVFLFIAVASLVYLAAFALLDTAGLLIGLIPAVIAGAFAVKRLGGHYD